MIDILIIVSFFGMAALIKGRQIKLIEARRERYRKKIFAMEIIAMGLSLIGTILLFLRLKGR